MSNDPIDEGIISQGKFVGSGGISFRSSSKSGSSGRHDHGLDIGAKRNFGIEKASTDKASSNTINREKEIEKRNKAAEARKKETLRMAKEETSYGTEARTKIKAVARPGDPEPTSEKSTLNKTNQIKTKIIDEGKPFMSDRNFGLPQSIIDATRQILEKKNDDGDAKKITGGKTPVDTEPTTNDKIEDSDDTNVKKKHTTPKSDKEKKLAALASPKDKITHKDVLVGRGVVKEEEIDESMFGPKGSPAGGWRKPTTSEPKSGGSYGKIKLRKTLSKKAPEKTSIAKEEESIFSQEELDRLDEISKSTLSSYVKKVAATPAGEVKKSREKGIETASKKLHEDEQLDEVNHREYAAKGKMHPDMAKDMKVGGHTDFYEKGSGDKKYGMVVKNDGRYVSVRASHKAGSYGKTHKFEVTPYLGEETEQLDEGVKTDNEFRGYHGEAYLDRQRSTKPSNKWFQAGFRDRDAYLKHQAHRDYSGAHTKVKKHAGEAGLLKDVSKPNVMIKHYLDSVHGRHIHGHIDDHEAVSRDFARFKKKYNPEHFSEELEQLVEGSKPVDVHKDDEGNRYELHMNAPIAGDRHIIVQTHKNNKEIGTHNPLITHISAKKDNIENIFSKLKLKGKKTTNEEVDFSQEELEHISNTLDEAKKAKSTTATITSAPLRGQNQDQSGFRSKGNTADYTISDETQQVAEISKKTLASYVTKAAQDVKKRAENEGQVINGKKSDVLLSKKFSEYATKTRKRTDNIAKAAHKLAKEEVDLEEGRGRPRKNPSPDGKETEGDDTHKHPMQQLEKISMSFQGNEPHFEHKDGSKTKISKQLARHIVSAHNSLRTSQEKDEFSKKLHANRDSMRSAMEKHF
jgi:hypothetical protein